MKPDLKAVLATATVVAFTMTGAYAVATTGDAPDPSTTPSESPSVVTNKNGKVVDEHAAFGQERAAEARAQHADPTEAPTEPGSEHSDNGHHYGQDPAHTDNGHHGQDPAHTDHGNHHGPKDAKAPKGPGEDKGKTPTS
jgi:hypothetical protein